MNRTMNANSGNSPFNLRRGVFRPAQKIVHYRQNGFFVIEVLIAFTIFLMVIGAVIPIWMQVQEKEKEYHMHSLALDVLHNEVNAFYTHSTTQGNSFQVVHGTASQKTVIMQNEQYDVHWKLQQEGSTAHSSGCGSINEWEVVVTWETPTQKSKVLKAQVCQN